jgi:CRP-like cAMP-binding protein
MPSVHNVLRALETLEFTRGFDRKQLESMASISTYVTFSEGATIFHEGDASDLVYLIVEGEVSLKTKVPGHDQVTILTLGPGQLLGWSSLFTPQQKTAGARANKATKAIAVNALELIELCKANTALGFMVMWRVADVIAGRLRAARQQLQEIFEPSGK